MLKYRKTSASYNRKFIPHYAKCMWITSVVNPAVKTDLMRAQPRWYPSVDVRTGCLFRGARCRQRWVTELWFTDQHLHLSPLTPLNVHTLWCQSVRNKWGEVLSGKMCSVSIGDLSLYPLTKVSSSWLHRQGSQVFCHTHTHLFNYASICLHDSGMFVLFLHSKDVISNYTHKKHIGNMIMPFISGCTANAGWR